MESGKKKGAGLIFAPRGVRDLRVYHPELSEVNEFKPLSAIELRFVWCYSVLYADVKDHSKRIARSIVDSYGKNLSNEEILKYSNREFPFKIEKAIEKMSGFDPSPRLKARYITERIFMAYNTIIDIDVKEAFTIKTKSKEGDLVTEEMDWGKLSQFVSATSKITEAMPEMIISLERGFGFGKDKDDNKVKDEGFAEEFMNGQ